MQNGQPGLMGRDDARMAAGALDPGDNPLGFMAARPFLGQGTAGHPCSAAHTDLLTRRQLSHAIMWYNMRCMYGMHASSEPCMPCCMPLLHLPTSELLCLWDVQRCACLPLL